MPLCGIARNLLDKVWLTDNAFKLVDYQFEFYNPFLTYTLNFKNLRLRARQAAQPVISNSSLKDLLIPIPPLKEQKSIVSKLDALKAETMKLEDIYKEKSAYLDELKKSILKKAFEGEL